MPKHTRRMPLISARHLPEGKPDWRRFDLASAEISFTTSLRLAKQRVHCRGHRSRGHARVFRRTAVSWRWKMRQKKYDAAVHSRFADKELGLICNNNFV
jgi:hypothetical protein